MPRSKAAVQPRKSKTYHHGNLRAALIEAGLALIQERGVLSLTLREIGSRVGVSRMAAYRHFSDKAALLAAIGEAGFTQFSDALRAARDAAAPDFASRIAAMAIAYVRFAAEHPAHYEVMFGAGVQARRNRPPIPKGAEAFQILEDTIRQGQQAGEVRPGDPTMLARLVWAQVHGLSMLRLESDLTPGAGFTFVLFCVEALQSGIATRQSGKTRR